MAILASQGFDTLKGEMNTEMHRIKCRNHPDCYIDCPNGGYAHYCEPYGPCKTGCDEAKSMDSLLRAVNNAPDGALFSGLVRGVTANTLSEFADKLGQFIKNAPAMDVMHLQQLRFLGSHKTYDAEWQKKSPSGIVTAIADATRDDGQVPVTIKSN